MKMNVEPSNSIVRLPMKTHYLFLFAVADELNAFVFSVAVVVVVEQPP